MNMADEIEVNEVAMSHKGKKVSSYSSKYKLEAIAHAENNSNNSASKKFNVDQKRIREQASKFQGNDRSGSVEVPCSH